MSVYIFATKPAEVADWSKTLVSQIQVGNMVAKFPGLNPTWDYDIDYSKLEITCRYSNSRALGDLWSLTVLNQETPNWDFGFIITMF